MEFFYEEGVGAEGELNSYENVRLAERSKQKLDSQDILAIKELGQFKEFSAVSNLKKLIEDWYISDLRIDNARSIQDAGYNERISTSDDNLVQVHVICLKIIAKPLMIF